MVEGEGGDVAAAAATSLTGLVFPLQARPNVQRAGEQVKGLCFGAISARGRGIAISAHTLQYAGVVETLVRWAAAELPASFTYTSIQVNKDYAAALHLDANNAGPSYIVGAGDFSGGQLWVHQQRYGRQLWEPPISGEIKVLDVSGGKWHSFDGNMPHCTLPFTGTRYTVIYFTQQSHHLMSADGRTQLQRLGFPLPSIESFEEAAAYPRRADRLEAGQEAYRRWRLQQPGGEQRDALPTHDEVMAVEPPAGAGRDSGVVVLLTAHELGRLRGHKTRARSPIPDDADRTRRRRRMRITASVSDADDADADAANNDDDGKIKVRVRGVSAEDVAEWTTTSPPPPPPRARRTTCYRRHVDLSIGAPEDILRVGRGLSRVRTPYRIARSQALDGKTVQEALRTLVPDKRGGTSLYTRVDMRYDLAREVLVLEASDTAATQPPPP